MTQLRVAKDVLTKMSNLEKKKRKRMGRMSNIVSDNLYYKMWYVTVRVTRFRVSENVLKCCNLRKKDDEMKV